MLSGYSANSPAIEPPHWPVQTIVIFFSLLQFLPPNGHPGETGVSAQHLVALALRPEQDPARGQAAREVILSHGPAEMRPVPASGTTGARGEPAPQHAAQTESNPEAGAVRRKEDVSENPLRVHPVLMPRAVSRDRRRE